jgi:hypothetical protein
MQNVFAKQRSSRTSFRAAQPKLDNALEEKMRSTVEYCKKIMNHLDEQSPLMRLLAQHWYACLYA